MGELVISGVDKIYRSRKASVHAVKTFGEGPINGKIISCQWLGDQTHVAVEVDGQTVVSVAHERVKLEPGSEVSLGVAAADLHLFDAETGQSIAHGGSLA